MFNFKKTPAGSPIIIKWNSKYSFTFKGDRVSKHLINDWKDML